jgi:hypothetical protein
LKKFETLTTADVQKELDGFDRQKAVRTRNARLVAQAKELAETDRNTADQTSNATIGKTLDQCTRKYGQGIASSNKIAYSFNNAGISIIVVFLKDKAAVRC